MDSGPEFQTLREGFNLRLRDFRVQRAQRLLPSCHTHSSGMEASATSETQIWRHRNLYDGFIVSLSVDDSQYES